ncbi:MAG: sialidase family protein, partial [Candidatus Binatia bacterium]
SYTSIPVPNATGGSGDWISADPTQSGRFAIMQRKGSDYEVFVTPDSGVTWTGPLAIAAPSASKPWMDYGSNGVLGVMWKDTAAGNVYSAILRPDATSFTTALQVNQQPDTTGFRSGPGDDLSWITVDGDFAYVGWGDTRSGYTNPYFAKVPLSLYQ